jgi:replicative DNA helicase
VIPFLKNEYFHDKSERLIFENILEFFTKYNTVPSKEAVIISLEKLKSVSEQEFKTCSDLVESFDFDGSINQDWLVNETENFCKDKAIYNSIMDSIQIIDGKDSSRNKTAIPELLSKALSVSFDVHIGHDYTNDSEKRFEFYHQKERKIAFDIEYMNTITAGGTPTKTLNVVMAGTGVGKSLFLCHHAANCLVQNHNVLYITCEMAEERIAERIDANLLDVTMDDLKDMPLSSYMMKINNVVKNINSRLIIKEYPTSSAGSTHFRALLDELQIKKGFKPDIIFIDYLNICASSRIRNNGAVNSYTLIKAIAEELRALAVEKDIPIWTATQTNREGYSNTDVGLENTSESFGLPATTDFMIALISTEELEEANQIMVKQLKNRYNNAMSNRKFVIGLNRSKMKLSDIPSVEQPTLVAGNTTNEQEAGSGYDMRDKFKKMKTSSTGDWKF